MDDQPNLHSLLGVHVLPAQLRHDMNLSLSEQAVMLMRQGNVQHARQLCQQLLAQNQYEVNALHLLGLISSQEKNHAQAIDYFSQVIKLQPDCAVAYFNLGQILLHTRQYALAEKAFASTLQLVPERWQAQMGLAQALAYLGQIDASLQYLKKVIAKQETVPASDVALAFMHKGMLRGVQGVHQKALQCFEQAISLNPQLVPAHYGKANALRALGRLAEAEKSVKQTFVLDHQYAPAYFLFGTMLEKTRQYTEALRCFDRAILLAPQFSDAHESRKRVLQVLGLQNPAGMEGEIKASMTE